MIAEVPRLSICQLRDAPVSSIPAQAVSPSLHLSPSLHGAAGTSPLLPAHEVKFVLTEDQARQVETALRAGLLPDPHGGAGGYTTTTLYCDTPERDVFHRRGGLARRKFRLRRYGHDAVVYLERKAKQGTRVRKRRCGVAVTELERLNETIADLDWDGGWFHRRLLQRTLQPVLAVRYDRTAYFGENDDGPLRLTFDRAIHGRSVCDWRVEPFGGGAAVLADRVVCEFKFRGAMPALFKSVVEAHRLSPGAASKYRLCLAAVDPTVAVEAGHA
jgi:hypothetical protein